MPRLQGLVFDLDGTLVDSAPDLRQALNALLAEQNRRSVTLEEVQNFVGDGILVTLQRAFAATGTQPQGDPFPHVQRFFDLYREIPPHPSQVYPHVRAFLDRCRESGTVLGVCTNKQEAATYRILEGLNLRHYFEFIAGGDTFPVHKPNPEHVRGTITGMDVETTGCLMVGDSRNDVLAAHGAGIPCIVVAQGYGSNLEELGADTVIPGFQDLPAALGALGYDFG